MFVDSSFILENHVLKYSRSDLNLSRLALFASSPQSIPSLKEQPFFLLHTALTRDIARNNWARHTRDELHKA